jgi:hypothetical protein
LLKGALIGLDLLNPPPQVVSFQYNPDSLTRTLKPRIAAPGADRSEALRLQGPPEETIRLEVELDATDALAAGDDTARRLGIHSSLAALERLVYPGAASVIANEVLLRLGVMEIVAPMAPLTLFVWSVKRVLPVLIEDYSITEEAFDPALNPIRAKVGLNLRVLSYHDLGLTSVGGGLFMAHQLSKEAFAILDMIDNRGAIASNASAFFTSI